MKDESERDVSPSDGGHEIPGFENLTRIGSGGSSTVYRATDLRHRREVAIKVLDDQTDSGPQRSAFHREIEAIGRIGNHPNIVTVLGSGFTIRSHPFLVLPLFIRGTYSQLIDEHGPLKWADALDVGIKLCSAVETVHRAGVVHRDIKPGNVFVGVTPQQPLLAHFGISSTVDGERTRTQTMAVTFGYTAPEVLDDNRPTPASDIYSLGMTIFRLIQGLHAYYAETPAAVMRKMLADSDRPQLSAGVPGSLAEVVADALAKQPENRPSSAFQLARRLQAVQYDHHLPVTDVLVADEPGAIDPEHRDPPPRPPTSPRPSPSTPPPSTSQSANVIESSMLEALTNKTRQEAPMPAMPPLPAMPTTSPVAKGRAPKADVGALLASAINETDSGHQPDDTGSHPTEGEKRSLDLPTVVTPRKPRSALQNPAPEPAPRSRRQQLQRWTISVCLVAAAAVAIVALVVYVL